MSVTAHTSAAAGPPKAAPAGFTVVLIGLFTLWDYYLPGAGLRPFDLLGVCLLLAAVLSGVVGEFLIDDKARRALAWIWAAVAFLSLLGIAAETENVRPTLGVLLGASAFSLVLAFPSANREQFARAIGVCIVIHCVAFWVQFVAQVAFGVLINYHVVTGGEPRVFGKAFRACGLLLEPAHFAVSMFLLVNLLYSTRRRLGWYGALAILSAFASVSLWGIVAFIGWLVLTLRSKPWLWISAATICLGLALTPAFWALLDSFWLVKRVLSLGSDSGVAVRYAVLLSTVGASWWDVSTWFGAGFTNEYLDYGASGWGFLVRAAGVVGSVAIAAGLLSTFERRDRLFLGFSVLIALTATTLWTYMLWWVWLALLIRRPWEPRGADLRMEGRT